MQSVTPLLEAALKNAKTVATVEEEWECSVDQARAAFHSGMCDAVLEEVETGLSRFVGKTWLEEYGCWAWRYELDTRALPCEPQALANINVMLRGERTVLHAGVRPHVVGVVLSLNGVVLDRAVQKDGHDDPRVLEFSKFNAPTALLSSWLAPAASLCVTLFLSTLPPPLLSPHTHVRIVADAVYFDIAALADKIGDGFYAVDDAPLTVMRYALRLSDIDDDEADTIPDTSLIMQPTVRNSKGPAPAPAPAPAPVPATTAVSYDSDDDDDGFILPPALAAAMARGDAVPPPPPTPTPTPTPAPKPAPAPTSSSRPVVSETDDTSPFWWDHAATIVHDNGSDDEYDDPCHTLAMMAGLSDMSIASYVRFVRRRAQQIAELGSKARRYAQEYVALATDLMDADDDSDFDMEEKQPHKPHTPKIDEPTPDVFSEEVEFM